VNFMIIDDEPFAAMLIEDHAIDLMQKGSLLSILSLVHALSAFIHFVFPTSLQVSLLVDSVFDTVFRKSSNKSKGILYMRDITELEKVEMLNRVMFVFLTDLERWPAVLEKKIPHVYIFHDNNLGICVKLNYLEQIQNKTLMKDLYRCVRNHQKTARWQTQHSHFNTSPSQSSDFIQTFGYSTNTSV
jgi:hypothetical protein